jgi:YVTN family beta-propeller protein
MSKGYVNRLQEKGLARMKVFNRTRAKQPGGHTAWSMFLLLVVAALGVSACAPAPSTSGGLIPNTGPTSAASAAPATTVAPATETPMASMAPTTAPPSAAQPGSPKAYIGLFKDNAVAVLDTGTNKVIKTIPVPTGPHGMVVTSDGRWVYVSSDGDSKVSIIDTSTDAVVSSIEVGKSPHGLAITPDGKLVLAAVFGTSQVAFIDTASRQVVGQVSVPSPHNIAISPDGQTAYVAAQKQGSTGLAELNISTKSQRNFVSLDKVPRALNYSPDGKLLYFTLAGVDAVQVLDPATNQVTAQIDVGASPHHPLFVPDGSMALVVSQGPGELYFLDPKTSAAFMVAKVGTMPHWIAVDPHGTTAWVTNEASNDVSVVDLAHFNVIATIPVGNAPRKIVVQPGMAGAAQAPSADPAATTVLIRAMAFDPSALTVKAGQTVTWVNQDSIAHTVTDDQGGWDSGSLAPGASFQHTFAQAGDDSYHCSIHPFMTSKIVVTP